MFSYYSYYIFKRKCKNCDAGIVQRYGKYCPICGFKNTLEWGDGDKMKYPLLETHENGKLTKCPICGEKSAFYNNNLLNSWDYNNAESPDAFMNIPDDIDEELPFN